MIDVSKACLMCNGTTSLDTQTTITTSDDSYRVAICGACEDVALPKAMREKITERINKVKSLISEVNSLFGLSLDLRSLLAPSASRAERAESDGPTMASEPIKKASGGKMSNVIQAAKPIVKGKAPVAAAAGGDPSMPTIGAQSNFKQAPMEVVRNPQGQRIDVPKGIEILKNETDLESKSGVFGERVHAKCGNCRDGYNNNKRCKFCGGSGLLPLT